MKDLKSNDIKTLHSLTVEYHKARKLFTEALDFSAVNNTISLCEKLSELEAAIMVNLNAKCSVVSNDSKIVIQIASGQGIHLEHFTQEGYPVKFKMELVDASKATEFKSEAEAQDLIKAVEYSIFRNYINGIGA